MSRIREYDPSDGAAWDDYVRASPHSHFGQCRAWCDLLTRRFGAAERSFVAEEDGYIAGLLPLFQRRAGARAPLFTPPGGLIADDAATASALVRAAAPAVGRGRARWIELRDQKTRWTGLDTVEENATLVLALERDPDTQWKAFDAKLRNQIRKGLKAGFTVHEGRDQLPAFHRVMLENMRDLGTPLMDLAYFGEVLDRFGADATVLVIRLNGEPAGAMFLIAHRDTLMDPWASSLRRFFAHCPNQALYWEALKYAIARGLRHFDFGRSQWDSNTFRFKTQWGAQPVPLYYQYLLAGGEKAPTIAAQKSGLALAVRMWQKLPLPLAARIGPHVRRMFPEAL